MIFSSNNELKRQLLFLALAQHYSQSGSEEDLDTLRDLCKMIIESLSHPCSQTQAIRGIVSRENIGPYDPDTINRLAREGIDALSSSL